MWSAQGQCIFKGNFGCDFLLYSFSFFLCLFLSLTWTHTQLQSPSVVSFSFTRSLSLFPFMSLSLPHRLSYTGSQSFLSFPFFFSSPIPSSLTHLSFSMLEKCLFTHHGAQRKLGCNNWIIEQSANKHKTHGTGSIWNACIIWGGQRQYKVLAVNKAVKQLAVQD